MNELEVLVSRNDRTCSNLLAERDDPAAPPPRSLQRFGDSAAFACIARPTLLGLRPSLDRRTLASRWDVVQQIGHVHQVSNRRTARKQVMCALTYEGKSGWLS